MGEGFLFDIKAIELADEKAEFCGRLLAGAGADVLKIEPPEGSPTRKIGPFVDDVPDPERSLHFWHYNFGKQSLALDVATPAGAERLKELAAGADVLLESHPPGYLASLGLGYDTLSTINPRLVMASITPFGQTGPWKDWKGADIVHLALGGVMMVTGYDPTPEGFYDTPPIAPQMWHANHIVGSQTLDAILGALLYRERTGRGQHIDASIHRAVSCNTGTDTTAWVFGRQGVLRQTARYGSSRMVPETLATTKDGRHILAFVSAEFMIGREHKNVGRDAGEVRLRRRPHRPQVREPRIRDDPRGHPPLPRRRPHLGRQIQVRPRHLERRPGAAAPLGPDPQARGEPSRSPLARADDLHRGRTPGAGTQRFLRQRALALRGMPLAHRAARPAPGRARPSPRRRPRTGGRRAQRRAGLPRPARQRRPSLRHRGRAHPPTSPGSWPGRRGPASSPPWARRTSASSGRGATTRCAASAASPSARSASASSAANRSSPPASG